MLLPTLTLGLMFFQLLITTRAVQGTTVEVEVDDTISVHYVVLGFAYHF